MHKVTLIGMPGSGKSAVGKILAARLGWEFVDTDRCIEARHGLPLQTLIDRVGEAAFAKIEEDAILELEVCEGTVISTGGSAVYSEAAMRHLSLISTVVFIDADFAAILRHIGSEAPRGIVGLTAGGLEVLLLERVPLYRRWATVVVASGADTPEEIAGQILSELPKV